MIESWGRIVTAETAFSGRYEMIYLLGVTLYILHNNGNINYNATVQLSIAILLLS